MVCSQGVLELLCEIVPTSMSKHVTMLCIEQYCVQTYSTKKFDKLLKEFRSLHLMGGILQYLDVSTVRTVAGGGALPLIEASNPRRWPALHISC